MKNATIKAVAAAYSKFKFHLVNEKRADVDALMLFMEI